MIWILYAVVAAIGLVAAFILGMGIFWALYDARAKGAPPLWPRRKP
jgi:high-affinity Fe2+/Pb2+ permease